MNFLTVMTIGAIVATGATHGQQQPEPDWSYHGSSTSPQEPETEWSQQQRRLEEFFVGGDGVEDNLVLQGSTTGAGSGSRGSCGIKSCHQYVTGRGLSYARALQIIQSEQFLDAVVSGRRIRRFRRKSSNTSGTKNRPRQGKQIQLNGANSGSADALIKEILNGEADVNDFNDLKQLITSPEGLKIGGVAAAAGGGAVAAASAAFMALPGAAVGVPSGRAGSVLPAVGQPMPNARNGATIPKGAGPIPPGVGPGGVPVGQPIPGSVEGSGILPLGRSGVVQEAMEMLEPLGLATGLVIPVAVFPAHAETRSSNGFKSVSIIYLEMTSAPVRKSLSLWASKEKNLAIRARKHKVVSGRPNAFNGMREALTRKLQNVALNLKCFLPRLKHNLMQHELENNSRLKKKINNAVTPILQKRRSLVRAVASAAAVGGKRMMQDAGMMQEKQGIFSEIGTGGGSGSGGSMRVTQAQMFAKNCFPEPEYGFRTKIILSEEPCVGRACHQQRQKRRRPNFAKRAGMPSGDPHYPTLTPSSAVFSRRHSNLEFTPDGPPTCSVEPDYANCYNRYANPYQQYQRYLNKN